LSSGKGEFRTEVGKVALEGGEYRSNASDPGKLNIIAEEDVYFIVLKTAFERR